MDSAGSKSAARNPWAFYDTLIESIPDDVCVADWALGTRWCYVDAECGMGVAMTLTGGRSSTRPVRPVGQRLKELAALSKSWNLQDASLGVAAINAWYCQHDKLDALDAFYDGEDRDGQNKELFDPLKGLQAAMGGKDVCVIGHFPDVYDLASACRKLIVLERKPTGLDYPDSACEFVLPSQDFVIATGTTVANKTFVRLAELSEQATFVICGPSAVCSSVLFEFGVDASAGRVVVDPEQARYVITNGHGMPFGSSIRRVAVYKPSVLEGLGLRAS